MNFIVVAPGMPLLFWCSWLTYSERHTAQYLATEMERVIADIESQTTALVTGINAANMIGATNRIRSRCPHLVGGGCAAHVLNLLTQDVCQHQAIRQVRTRALAITRFLRDHHAMFDEFSMLEASARYKGSRIRALVVPIPTRWYSVHNCLRNVLHARGIIEELFVIPNYQVLGVDILWHLALQES